MNDKKIKIVLADDQVLFAKSVARVINEVDPHLDIVEIVLNGSEAVEAVRRIKPDVMLMDVRMPVMDGVEATKIICKEFPEILVIILTTFDDDTYVHEALANGAAAYVLKTIEPEELVSTIHAIKNMNKVISSGNLRNGNSLNKSQPAETATRIADGFPQIRDLTERQQTVLELIIQGYDNQSISEKLFISHGTVRNYVSLIYQKLDVTNRFELLRYLGKES